MPDDHILVPNLPARSAPANANALQLRKRQAFGILDLVCQQLEPTKMQLERAESAYTAIGNWLADDPLLAQALIYVQGSIAHGTATKPIFRNEHDVDLICHVPGYGPSLPPAVLKLWIGNRLAAHDVYRPMLEEMPRCWRLNYAGDFHLDLTPTILNPACGNGGELVPDKKLKEWKASNPKGFRDLFARRANLVPQMPGQPGQMQILGKADIEPFPVKSVVKGVLRRAVQLQKRHRDVAFEGEDPALAPLSIIITSLASQAYEWCVRHQAYDNELDLLCDTIRAMPRFIESTVVAGRKHWLVLNETTQGENFAEKWNMDPNRAKRFFAWHAAVLADFEALASTAGLDQIGDALSGMLGSDPVARAMRVMSDDIGDARKSNRLYVAPAVGLAVGASSGTAVRANTFFGK